MQPTPQYVSYTKCTAFELSDFGEKEIAFNHISVVLVLKIIWSFLVLYDSI